MREMPCWVVAGCVTITSNFSNAVQYIEKTVRAGGCPEFVARQLNLKLAAKARIQVQFGFSLSALLPQNIVHVLTYKVKIF